MGNLNNTISCDHVFQYYECDKNGRVILSKLMSMKLLLINYLKSMIKWF